MEESARTILTPDAQLFHDVFDASSIGVAVENSDGQPLFVNPALCSMLGFSAEELCGKHCVDFSPSEDAEKDFALFQQLRAGTIDRYQLEKRYFRRDGSLVWGNLSVSLLKGGPSLRVLAMVEDITDKKRAEEARSRHAAIVGSSEDAIASVTPDGIIESWNRGAQRIFGYTESEAVGQSVRILVPPELPDEENKILETLKTGGRIDQFETIRVTKTGKRIDVSQTISPIKDSRGKTVGFSGISRDITQRKRAEEALRVSEERLRLAYQAARLGIFERDVPTGRITWSEGLESLYGLPLGSLEGKTTALFKELIHPTDYEHVVRLLEDALQTGQPTEGECRANWPDGSVHWIAGRWQVLMNASGEPSRVVGVNMDITERKRAEEALLEMNRTLEQQGSLLRSREELLRVFVKNVPAAVAMLDRDMRYLQASDRWCSDYLLGRAQILGCSHYEIFPDMPERWKEVHRRALQGETLRADEDRWDGQDGPHWARWEVRPWKTADGAVGGILILAEDTTRRKRMEEDLSRVSQKLIEAHEEERNRIARELHDDVNQRLALLAVSLEGSEQNPHASAAELQEEIGKTVKQLHELGNDIQAISHQLHSSKLEYLGLASAAASFCRELSHRPGIHIDFQSENIPKNLPKDISVCLFRTLQEGLQNAIKHSGSARFQVSLTGGTNQIELIVRDSGMGFDIEEAMKGDGLGLTSMIERLKLVNGTLSIESQRQRGTTVHARVPLPSGAKSAGASA